MVIKETLVVRNETYCWYPELNHYSWCQTETKILEIVPIGNVLRFTWIHINVNVFAGSLIILSFLFGLITFTAIYGNGLVVYLVATTKSLHNTTHYLLANLAISDILLAVVCIPFQFYAALIQRWDLPHFMCKLCPFTQIFSVNVSIFTQIAIALDRYGATTQPLSNSDNSRTKKRIFVLIWAIAFLLASPVPSFFQIRYLRDAEYRGMKPYCSSWSDEEAHKYGAIMPSKANLTSFAPSWMTHENYVLATFTYQYLIPVVFIGVMYIHMCIVVWKRNIPGINLDEQAKELWRQKKKIIRIKIWILLAFVVCWLPWQIIHVAAKVYPEATRYVTQNMKLQNDLTLYF